MSGTRVLTLKFKLYFFKNVIEFVVQKRVFSLMTLSLLVGEFIGVLFQFFCDTADWTSYLNEFIISREVASFLSIFKASFGPHLIFAFIAFLSGLFIFGTIPSVLLPFVKGVGIGFSAAQFLCVYSFKGLLLWMFVLLPTAFISSGVLAFACTASFKTSAVLIECLRRTDNDVVFLPVFKKFIFSYLVVFLLLISSSVMDSLLSCAMIHLFNF